MSRCTLHRVIPGSYEAPRRGIRTTVFGEQRKDCHIWPYKYLACYYRPLSAYFDPTSEGRAERVSKQRAVESEQQSNGYVFLVFVVCVFCFVRCCFVGFF